jgi:uncharacterized protein (TIGR02996 family)
MSSPLADESAEAAFLREIRDRPNDPTPRLVYADWLEERGDPRAEYLRLEHQLTQIPARLKELDGQLDPDWVMQVRGRHIRARLKVRRGVRPGREYPIWDGPNYLGRAGEQPVDIDLSDQELPDRVWVSDQHALILCESGTLTLEDLNSATGTYVNRVRLMAGRTLKLQSNDILQIGAIRMIVLA